MGVVSPVAQNNCVKSGRLSFHPPYGTKKACTMQAVIRGDIGFLVIMVLVFGWWSVYPY